MDEGFPAGARGARGGRVVRRQSAPLNQRACAERRGPTPRHPEPGRETRQRRWYWRDARRESRSVRPTERGVEQWQLVGLITRRSVVRIHPPLPHQQAVSVWKPPVFFPALCYVVIGDGRFVSRMSAMTVGRSAIGGDVIPTLGV